MPDKTQFDLETLLLLVIAIFNPMIAVFMMKGCGKEFVICILLFVLMLVSLSSFSSLTYQLTTTVPGFFQLGSTPTISSAIVTGERSLVCLLSLGYSLPGPMLSSCREPALHLLLPSRP